MLSNEPETIDNDNNMSSKELKKINQALEERTEVLKKWSNYDMEPPKPPEPPKTPEKKPEEKKKTGKKKLDLPEDYTITIPKAFDGPEYRELREDIKELNSLIGLAEVKRNIETLMLLMHFNQKQAAKPFPVSKNLVFSGSPGTGKTTVAKIVARIYKHLHVVKQGQFVQTNRAGMVAGFTGQTSGKVRDRFLEAKEGVLFIDEAYSLCTNSQDTFGKEALDEMVNCMPDDDKSDTAVILAGYADLIETLFTYNEGLRSRFNTYINFADYSSKQLMQIFKRELGGSDLKMDEGAEKALKSFFDLAAPFMFSFGNARFVRQQFSQISNIVAQRYYKKNESDVKDPIIIRADVEECERKFYDKLRRK